MKILSPMASGFEKCETLLGIYIDNLTGTSSAAGSVTSVVFSIFCQLPVLGLESTYILNHIHTSNN
jgi:hypothetical protein